MLFILATDHFLYLFYIAATSIMSQFPDVNPYRWPGWFIFVMAMVYGMTILICFTETKSLSSSKKLPCSEMFQITRSMKLTSGWKMKVIVSTLCVHE